VPILTQRTNSEPIARMRPSAASVPDDNQVRFHALPAPSAFPCPALLSILTWLIVFNLFLSNGLTSAAASSAATLWKVYQSEMLPISPRCVESRQLASSLGEVATSDSDSAEDVLAFGSRHHPRRRRTRQQAAVAKIGHAAPARSVIIAASSGRGRCVSSAVIRAAGLWNPLGLMGGDPVLNCYRWLPV